MYIKIINGNPEIYTIGQLRRDNPNTSFPKTPSAEILEKFSIYPCDQEPQPLFDDRTQLIEDGGIIQDETGKWVKTWNIIQKTQEELDAWIATKEAEVRNKRNYLLTETDYLALSDNTLTPEMATYRQELRDITNQAGFPENVEWPVKP